MGTDLVVHFIVLQERVHAYRREEGRRRIDLERLSVHSSTPFHFQKTSQPQSKEGVLRFQGFVKGVSSLASIASAFAS